VIQRELLGGSGAFFVLSKGDKTWDFVSRSSENSFPNFGTVSSKSI